MRRRLQMSALAVLLLGGAAPPPAPARAPARPVVLELFTSEGCSSCPPADALLRELAAGRADVLALAFHVTYWNQLGWRDPFSLEAATSRQRAYAGSLPSEVYTPQLVVDGRHDVVGSDRRATIAAIGDAAAAQADPVAASVRRDGDMAVVTLGRGIGDARVLLVGYDREHTTEVARGENTGRRLVEANIVRGVEDVARWAGAPLDMRHLRPAGERLAVIVQAADGRILAAAREDGDAR